MLEEEFVALLWKEGIIRRKESKTSEFVQYVNADELVNWLEVSGVIGPGKLMPTIKRQHSDSTGLKTCSILETNIDVIKRQERKTTLVNAKDSLEFLAVGRSAAVAIGNDLLARKWIRPPAHLTSVSPTVFQDSPAIVYEVRLDVKRSIELTEQLQKSKKKSPLKKCDSLKNALLNIQNELATIEKEKCKKEEKIEILQREDLHFKLWSECFPKFDRESNSKLLGINDPIVMFYVILGMNIINKQKGTLPTFSRDLKLMDVNQDQRTAIMNYLAKISKV